MIEQINTLDERYYRDSAGNVYPSVTMILSEYPKGKQFDNWQKAHGFSSDIIMERAGRRGTNVHDAIETLLNTGNIKLYDSSIGDFRYAYDELDMILRFYDFYTKHDPEVYEIESRVVADNEGGKYGGTIDLICDIDGEVWLIDHKTSANVYDTHRMQVAAYVKGVSMNINRAGILHLDAATRTYRKGKIQGPGWNLVEVDIETEFKNFCNWRKIYDQKHPNQEPKDKIYPKEIVI